MAERVTEIGDLPRRIESLVEPALERLGIQLVDVEYRFEGRWVLRLLIDRKEGVTLEDCARVSGAVGELLDERDLVPNDYSLEVSSPGLFRPLRGPKHFRQAVGKMAKFRLAAEFLTERRRRELRGRIEAVGEDALTLALEGGDDNGKVELPFEAIRHAKLDPEF